MLKTRPKLKDIKKNQKGFTLVELLIYMALLSFLLISISEMFVAILNIKVDSEAITSVEQDTQFIVARMLYDINRADSIATPVNPGDVSDTLVLDVAGNIYTYVLNGNNLELTNNAGTFKLNSNEATITTLDIQKIGPAAKSTVKISITINSVTTTNTGPETKNINFTAGLR